LSWLKRTIFDRLEATCERTTAINYVTAFVSRKAGRSESFSGLVRERSTSDNRVGQRTEYTYFVERCD
jgi:hypothetical protein